MRLEFSKYKTTSDFFFKKLDKKAWVEFGDDEVKIMAYPYVSFSGAFKIISLDKEAFGAKSFSVALNISNSNDNPVYKPFTFYISADQKLVKIFDAELYGIILKR